MGPYVSDEQSIMCIQSVNSKIKRYYNLPWKRKLSKIWAASGDESSVKPETADTT
jgi:hypothetical protein